MHAEHAELIAALRRENFELNARIADLSQLKTIIDAQDIVFAKAQRTMQEQGRVIDQQLAIILDLTQKLEDALRCP